MKKTLLILLVFCSILVMGQTYKGLWIYNLTGHTYLANTADSLFIGYSTSQAYKFAVNGAGYFDGKIVSNDSLRVEGDVLVKDKLTVMDSLGIGITPEHFIHAYSPVDPARFVLEGTDNVEFVTITYDDNFTNDGDTEHWRARGTRAAPTIVLDNNQISSIKSRGYNGGATTFGFSTITEIAAEIDGTWTTAPPGRLIFRLMEVDGAFGSEFPVMKMLSNDSIDIPTGSIHVGGKTYLDNEVQIDSKLTIGTSGISADFELNGSPIINLPVVSDYLRVRDSLGGALVLAGSDSDGDGDIIMYNSSHAVVNRIRTDGSSSYFNSGGTFGLNTSSGLSTLSINGGLHVGGDSDAGDNNLLVDGTAIINTIANATGDFLTAPTSGGLVTQRTASEVASDIGAVTSTASANYIPKMTSATAIENTGMFELASIVHVGVGTRFEVDDTTEATTTTDGALESHGGLSVAKSAVIGLNVKAATYGAAAVTDTELGYVDGATSNIQTQLGDKQDIVANVSDTEIGYLDGVTSSLQNQIDSKINEVDGIFYAEINLTALNVNNLGSTTTLIGAAGAGKAYILLDCYVKIDVNTSYLEVGVQSLNIRNGTNVIYTMVNSAVENASSSLNLIEKTNATNIVIAENTTINAILSSATNPTSNDATMTIHLVYKKIDY